MVKTLHGRRLELQVLDEEDGLGAASPHTAAPRTRRSRPPQLGKRSGGRGHGGAKLRVADEHVEVLELLGCRG